MSVDLLILFADGERKIVKNVSNCEYLEEQELFCITKNDHKFFLTRERVKAVGSADAWHSE